MAESNVLKHTSPVYKKGVPDDSFKFQPLPPPTGAYPYRLQLTDIMPHASNQKMVFNMVGDTGSVRSPGFQRLVAGQMIKQITQDEPPGFLFHLGDVVYNFGEAENYYIQFFEPYNAYPGPVFAIAGNHDGDVNPALRPPRQSLDAFRTVFCNTQIAPISFSNGNARKSLTQPNVYWTLNTPLATIIGLYSNVTKYGLIDDTQKQWFAHELKAAAAKRPGSMIIVCVHHSPYSADVNHSSSLPVIQLLNDVIAQTGIIPDAVFSGHVHNYQRFHKHYPDGTYTPYIVAGGGGYDELHAIASLADENFSGSHPLFKNVKLENYVDSSHGFLKISIENCGGRGRLTGRYYTVQSTGTATAQQADTFVIYARG